MRAVITKQINNEIGGEYGYEKNKVFPNAGSGKMREPKNDSTHISRRSWCHLISRPRSSSGGGIIGIPILYSEDRSTTTMLG